MRSLRSSIRLALTLALLGSFVAQGDAMAQQTPAKGRLVLGEDGKAVTLAKKRRGKKEPKQEEPKQEEVKEEEGDDAESAEGSEDTKEAAATTEEGAQSQMSGGLRRGNRMEFDARLIRGETAGSGAVFLFQRAPRPLPSMVPLRTSYLHETIDQRLGQRYSKNLTEAKAKALKDKVREQSDETKNKSNKK